MRAALLSFLAGAIVGFGLAMWITARKIRELTNAVHWLSKSL